MDNVTVYMETVYNSSNSMNSTRNLNKNRKKSNSTYVLNTVSSSGEITYSEVKMFLKQKPDVIMKYKSLRTLQNKTITLTGNHLLHARKRSSDMFFPL